MKVPLLDTSREYRAHKPQIDQAVRKVMLEGKYINGPEVTEFEKKLSEYLDRHERNLYAVGVSSGTDALLLALKALEIGEGDQVLVPDYTFVATVEAVLRVGATPVLVDVDENGNMDIGDAVNKINGWTKAAIVVHLFGKSLDFTELKLLGIKIIEDCAQSFGTLATVPDTQFRGPIPYTGTVGDIGCFSFFPSKNLGCMGDGGAVITYDIGLSQKMRILRSHGQTSKNWTVHLGGNFRLDTIQAAVLLAKLPFVKNLLSRRYENARLYNDQLKDIPDIILPPRNTQHTYNQYVIRVKNREELMDQLKWNDIGHAVYYPCSISAQPLFKSYGTSVMSKTLSKEMLALPIGPFTTEEEIMHVCTIIREFYQSDVKCE